jgi:hypothetical protein
MGEFRGTVTVRRQGPISTDEYSRVLAALNQRHDELDAVGGGGSRDTAMFVMSTDRWNWPAQAAGEMLDAIIDALQYTGLADVWPEGLALEAEADEELDEPRAVHG